MAEIRAVNGSSGGGESVTSFTGTEQGNYTITDAVIGHRYIIFCANLTDGSPPVGAVGIDITADTGKLTTSTQNGYYATARAIIGVATSTTIMLSNHTAYWSPSFTVLAWIDLDAQ